MITTPYQIYKIVRETTHHDISFHYYAKYFYCVHFLVNLCRLNKFMKISKYCNLLINPRFKTDIYFKCVINS